ncbi:hypothetical protein [Winogradskyella damuponensis]|uniref:Uncharacterized protein n=1 Tax=Winogradskyella damuponensis TaxID=943939 RepID=A0ABP8CJ41_9FLAO
MKLSEKDILKLDFLLDKMIDTDWLVTADDLHNSNFYSDKMSNKEMVDDFKYLLNVFDSTNSGTTNYEEDNTHVRPNERTIVFHRNGGFKEYFLTLKQKELDNTIEIKKETERQNLKDNIDKLKLEELNYKQTIRGLEEELKISNLLKNYWWLIASAIAVGVAIGEYLI